MHVKFDQQGGCFRFGVSPSGFGCGFAGARSAHFFEFREVSGGLGLVLDALGDGRGVQEGGPRRCFEGLLKVSREASGRLGKLFGEILGGLGRLLRRSWERFGRSLRGYREIQGGSWEGCRRCLGVYWIQGFA